MSYSHLGSVAGPNGYLMDGGGYLHIDLGYVGGAVWYGIGDDDRGWISYQSSLGQISLGGVNATRIERSAPIPASDQSSFYSFIGTKLIDEVTKYEYWRVAKSQSVDIIYINSYNTNINNWWGEGGTTSTISQILSLRPIDLLGPTLRVDIDGTPQNDFIRVMAPGGGAWGDFGDDTLWGSDYADVLLGDGGNNGNIS